MAETLSQFIGEVRRRRDQEFSQQMQSVLPILEADIQREKQDAEYVKQLDKYRADLALTLPKDQQQAFLGTQFNTVEGMTANYTKITDDINKEQQLSDLTSGYGRVLSTIDPSGALSQTFAQNAAGIKTPELLTATYQSTGDKWIRENPKNRPEVDALASNKLPTKWYNRYLEKVESLHPSEPPMTALLSVLSEIDESLAAANRARGGSGGGDGGAHIAQMDAVIRTMAKMRNTEGKTTTANNGFFTASNTEGAPNEQQPDQAWMFYPSGTTMVIRGTNGTRREEDVMFQRPIVYSKKGWIWGDTGGIVQPQELGNYVGVHDLSQAQIKNARLPNRGGTGRIRQSGYGYDTQGNRIDQ